MFDAITANIIEAWNRNHMGLIDSLFSGGGQPAPAAPQDNAQIAFNYFVSQGLSPVQAAGIVGNLQGESGQGLNTRAVDRADGRDGSDSIGIAQWNSGRAQALKDYAASKGTPYTDLTTQLEFLHSELKGPEKAAYDKLLAAQNPEEATRAFLAYERPKDWNVPGSHPQRTQYAARAFAAYGGGQPVGASASPASPSRASLSLPQQAPVFPQAQQQQAQQGGGGYQMPDPQAMQMAPIQFAQRRQPDLSKLKALFKAPTFYRG
jgi:hypothetical protein